MTSPHQDLDLASRHLRFGWSSLAIFAAIGIGLETLHGLKSDWYLNVTATARRELLTLGHAHGTLLSVINLCLAGVAHRLTGKPQRLRLASAALRAATLLMPFGFLLGGFFATDADPGIGIALVPAGALALLLALALLGSAAKPSRPEPPKSA